MNTPEFSPLGKPAAYVTQYDPLLLFPIPRLGKRVEIGIHDPNVLPFFGVDIWNAYEVSWLNLRGKPQVAIATIIAPADSPNIIESKSFKLYLNSFNQTKLDSPHKLEDLLSKDLSAGFGAQVNVELTLAVVFPHLSLQEPEGILLDQLDIDVTDYQPNAAHLKTDRNAVIIEEVLLSNLLKSNCLVTGQPDWGSVQIHYVGNPINREGLLKYLISFRDHNEFHEQCVERIFVDIMRHCEPQKLSVYARYTRRGGLDINPWRSNFSEARPENLRLARQ